MEIGGVLQQRLRVVSRTDGIKEIRNYRMTEKSACYGWCGNDNCGCGCCFGL